MALASCARCTKTVYPTEKLSCLDKQWHKGCFTCEVCNLKLTMKNYKGYNKLPYCDTHYPTTRFTAVADTPENKRLQKNTRNQSDVAYHKKFEEERGKFNAVADTPESLRLKASQKQASELQYRGTVQEGSRYIPPEAGGGGGSYQTAAPPQHYQPPAAPVPQQPQYEPEPAPAPPASKGARYEAIYDYTAADDDEVSFSEGDIIINVEIIDEGWMTGTVEKTGESGMLPSNYVLLL